MKEMKAGAIIAWVCGRGQGRNVRAAVLAGVALLSGCAGIGWGTTDGDAAGGSRSGAATELAGKTSAAAASGADGAGPGAVMDPAPAVVVPSAPPPTWRAVTASPLETWTDRRTPLYTYVLAGDIATPPVPAGKKAPNSPKLRAQRALQRVLSDVQADAFPEGPEADVALAAVHQFLVPAWPRTARTAPPAGQAGQADDPQDRLTLADVDLIKSRAHLELLRVLLTQSPHQQPPHQQPQMAQRLRGLGPFLVTTRQPLGELVQRSASGKLVVVDRSPVLLIDLGQRNDSTLLATVKTLKVVARDAAGQTGAIGPLRARVVSKLRASGVVLPYVAESPPPAAQRVK